MKKVTLFILAIFFLLSCSNQKMKAKNLISSNVKINNNFLIVKIDSIDDIIVLYAKRSDTVFKIVSLKKMDVSCDKIIIGEKYNLKIKSFFSNKYPQKLDIKGFKVSKTIIKLEKNGVLWDLFSSENLNGLCYIK